MEFKVHTIIPSPSDQGWSLVTRLDTAKEVAKADHPCATTLIIGYVKGNVIMGIHHKLISTSQYDENFS